MNKIFILFGASGTLGFDAVNYFLKKNFEYYYFISRKEIKLQTDKSNFSILTTEDLSNEKNVEFVFNKIRKDKTTRYFLFSTIGGFSGGKKIWETDISVFKKMLDINLTTNFLIAKHFSKFIKDTAGGSICFTSAASSLVNEPGKAVYGLSKNALNYLIKSLDIEGKELNLTANVLLPYAIDTPENREWVGDTNLLSSTKDLCDSVDQFFGNHHVIGSNLT